jgi:hypothetical protein
VVLEAVSEVPGFASDIVHNDRNDRQPEILEVRVPLLVADHLNPAGMPVDAFVLGHHAVLRPREVDAVHGPVKGPNLVLQFGQRQAVVDHD